MSSRRKASTPCMIRPEKTPLEPEDDEEESRKMEVTENHVQEAVLNMELSADSGVSDKDSDTRTGPDKPQKEPPDPHRPQRRQQGGYECKYCTFSTQNLNTFKDHVDSNHPNVILNPLYLCAVCNFTTKKFDTLTEHNERCHPGESNFKFKRVKVNKQTILEQSIEGSSSNAVIYNTARTAKAKTQCTDAKRTESLVGKPLTQLAKKPITALNVNGTVIIPESSLLKADSLSHIMPSLQQPVNYTQVPKIAVPLNTTKYNPTLDDNLTLMSSFNKFPYPTQAELSWLTAASKHPEEQIKVWFTTQRLKQGISWSPEEVEEARKKMFNGTISSAPQTLTVVASQLSSPSNQAANAKPFPSAASILQSLPCQILGQTSLVLTPVANGSSITCAPLALTLANQVTQSLKRPLATPAVARESKRPSIIQTTSSPKAPSFTADPNKTAEQLSVLRSSYTQSPFPEEDEIYRLIETTGLSREEIKKWFSEQRLLNLRSVASPPVLVKAEAAATVPDVPVRKAVPTQFPLLERVKGKSSEQLNALEESFQRSSSPTEKELDQLAQDIRLSKTEVDCWFSERRALRDNMEKVRFTMASKSTEERLERAGVALLNGGSHREQDGGAPSSSSSSSSSSPPVLAASSPQAPPNSSSRSPPILNSSSPHPPVLLASSSLSLISSGTLVLLREMFCRTQWPSPEEYSQLELQTRLGRTDIVRWFKDHRSALKNGQALDWMLPSQKQNQHQNGQICESDQSVSLEVKVKVAESGRNLEAAENSRRPSQDKRATQDENDVDQKSDGAPNKGRWVTASVAAGEETGFTEVTERQRPVTDTGVVTKEQPGRVTG